MTGNDKTSNTLQGKPEPCAECGGRGWLDNRCLRADQAHRCPYCDGRGVNVLGRTCYGCGGTGLMEIRMEDMRPCPQCGGAGVWPIPESMTIDEYAFNPRELKKGKADKK